MPIAMSLVLGLTVQISRVGRLIVLSQWNSYIRFIDCCSSLATVSTFYNVDVPVLRRMIADYERIMVTLDSNLETLSDIAQVDTAKTSKSTLSKAIASYVQRKYFLLNISDLQNPYVGETDTLIANLFKKVYEDKGTTYVLIFDEIDSILRDTNKGVSYNLIIIGIQNYKDDLSDAILRRVTYAESIDLHTMEEKFANVVKAELNKKVYFFVQIQVESSTSQTHVFEEYTMFIIFLRRELYRPVFSRRIV
ncbi:hypothetical protein PR048_012582, partial [Dryococelus australis]